MRLAVAPVAVVRGDQHHAGQFAVRAGQRLQGEGGHAGDLAQHALGLVEHLQRALRQHPAAAQLRQQRVQVRRSPAGAATASQTLGLYFIVQEPSG